jgi:hypothetical protein
MTVSMTARTKLSTCARKARFASEADALAFARVAVLVLHPYRCDRCFAFHLTSRTRGRRVPRAAGSDR